MFLSEKPNSWAAPSYAMHHPCIFSLRFLYSAEIKETLSPSTPYASLAFSAACTQRLVFSSEARLTAVHWQGSRFGVWFKPL